MKEKIEICKNFYQSMYQISGNCKSLLKEFKPLDKNDKDSDGYFVSSELEYSAMKTIVSVLKDNLPAKVEFKVDKLQNHDQYTIVFSDVHKTYLTLLKKAVNALKNINNHSDNIKWTIDEDDEIFCFVNFTLYSIPSEEGCRINTERESIFKNYKTEIQKDNPDLKLNLFKECKNGTTYELTFSSYKAFANLLSKSSEKVQEFFQDLWELKIGTSIMLERRGDLQLISPLLTRHEAEERIAKLKNLPNASDISICESRKDKNSFRIVFFNIDNNYLKLIKSSLISDLSSLSLFCKNNQKSVDNDDKTHQNLNLT